MTFHIESGDAGDLMAAKTKLKSAIKQSSRSVLNSRHALDSKVLHLGRSLVSESTAGAPQFPTDVRVIYEPEEVESGLRMAVALPFSKFDCSKEVQLSFLDAVQHLTGVANVVINEISDKPKDFKGGGNPCFESSLYAV